MTFRRQTILSKNTILGKPTQQIVWVKTSQKQRENAGETHSRHPACCWTDYLEVLLIILLLKTNSMWSDLQSGYITVFKKMLIQILKANSALLLGILGFSFWPFLLVLSFSLSLIPWLAIANPKSGFRVRKKLYTTYVFIKQKISNCSSLKSLSIAPSEVSRSVMG